MFTIRAEQAMNRYNSKREQHLAAANKQTTHTVQWVDDDHFTLTGTDKPEDYTRKASSGTP